MPASLAAQANPRQALGALWSLVLSAPELRETLGEIEDPRLFARRLAEAARALDLSGDEVTDLLQGPPQAPYVTSAPPSPGWLPAETTGDGEDAIVEWLWVGRRRLTAPFYDGSMAQARQLPFNRLFALRTPLSELEAWARALPAVEPAGLIFHMSRCGSTLAAQMLAASPADLVLSEPPPLDAVVQAAGLDDDAKVVLLRAMAAALGHARNGESRPFLKLDCWHSLSLPLFRRAFPDTPWVFVYRDPVEVLVSHLRRRGMQMVPSFVPPSTFGIDLPGGVPDADYCARVLAAVCQGVVEHGPEDGGRLVNYRDLPEALFTTILPHFGVAISDTEAALMRAAATRDAKAPGQAFTPDGQDKRQEASDDLRAICERRVGAVYRRLEAMRADQA